MVALPNGATLPMARRGCRESHVATADTSGFERTKRMSSARAIALAPLLVIGAASLCDAGVNCKQELSKKLTIERLTALLPQCKKEKADIESRILREQEALKRNEEDKRRAAQEAERLAKVPKLVFAVAAGDEVAVTRLIEGGADPSSRLPDGGVVRIPITANGLSSKGFNGSMTALMVAANIADYAMVKVLIAGKSDVNARDAEGVTALIYAVTATPFSRQAGAPVGSPTSQTVELLLAAGADVNAKATKGFSAISAAKNVGDSRVIELLRKAGAVE